MKQSRQKYILNRRASSNRRWLILLVLLSVITVYSSPVQAQYSSPGLWVESGLWLSVSGGSATPLADPMAANHGSGFMMNVSLEFQGAFFNFGLDGGMHRFAETAEYGEVIVYPLGAFIVFNLAQFYSNDARFNRDKKALHLRTGLGAGVYSHLAWEVTELFGGGYIPLELAYQHQRIRASAEFRFHQVFGILSVPEGSSQYGTFGFTLEYFLPL